MMQYLHKTYWFWNAELAVQGITCTCLQDVDVEKLVSSLSCCPFLCLSKIILERKGLVKEWMKSFGEEIPQSAWAVGALNTCICFSVFSLMM